MTIDEILTVSFTLFAVIDIIGSIPLLLSLKEKMGGIHEMKASLISGGLMIFFLFVGEKFFGILLIAGSGTLTTIISLRANYSEWPVLVGILINVIFVYLVLHSLDFIQRMLGKAGMLAIRKFFGVVLLAIAVKIFASNVGGLIK